MDGRRTPVRFSSTRVIKGVPTFFFCNFGKRKYEQTDSRIAENVKNIILSVELKTGWKSNKKKLSGVHFAR